MSKPNAACAILGALALSSMPLVAATIASEGTVAMSLGFDARQPSPELKITIANGTN